MRILKMVSAALLSILLMGAGVQAQTRAVREINKYVGVVRAISESAKKPHEIFADTADYETKDENPSWKQFPSEANLENYREKTKETFSIAYVWKDGGAIVMVRFTLFSPSGDWSQYDTNYFRKDGSIAKSESELRTFYGDFVILRTKWYNPAGGQISSSRAYRDLDTNKPLKKPRNDFETDVAWFKNVRELPFLK